MGEHPVQIRSMRELWDRFAPTRLVFWLRSAPSPTALIGQWGVGVMRCRTHRDMSSARRLKPP